MSTEERRRQNRERFPKVTGWVDMLNAAGMGPVRVIWCEENGQVAGKRP
jgi:hypothetical protein